MTLDTWLAFFVASWIISLSPGPGAFSCMATGMRYGYKKAVWNILGLQVGAMLLLVAVAVGLGAMLAASHTLFNAVKWFGVAYLVWLGIAQWRAQPKEGSEVVAQAVQKDQERSLDLFVRAFFINASNPKGIIFMLAVLPQFINPHATQWPQYLACAGSLLITDMVVMSGYTFFAARVLRALRGPKHVRWMNRIFGGLFIGAGIVLAGFKRG